jgi:endogenous inhibitor of DNA gyrase (YacG/DUF329 family)
MASEEQLDGGKRTKTATRSGNMTATTTTTTTTNGPKKIDDDDVRYCEFCGKVMNDLFSPPMLLRRKYCSERCRSIATNRLASARLGIPPARRSVSKLSNPLYFN